eukprot:TRINITY_DN45004_c0_g1_i1.p1 TRINITY_DN45004_c0_g1~~TRINITY_DN45004_c0_g1_i1.p1  ORF type:complete len:696 (-),score=124.78 TRINITY_DN45004_c0_g1_i1:54-2141(-)
MAAHNVAGGGLPRDTQCVSLPRLLCTASMSRSMPNLPRVKVASADIGGSQCKLGLSVKLSSPAKLKDSRSELRKAHLPLCSTSKGLQQLYGLVEELAMLWETLGLSDEQRHLQTETFAALAAGDVQQHIASCKQRMADLTAECESVLVEATRKLGELVGDIDEHHFTTLAADLQKSAASPLRQRLALLQKAHAKISEQVQELAELRRALADAVEVLGLDSSLLFSRIDQATGEAPGGRVTALAGELQICRKQLLERRAGVLEILEEVPQPSQLADNDPIRSVRDLITEVEAAEARMLALRSNTVTLAAQARSIWEELGEQPKPRSDDYAVRLSADSTPEGSVTRSEAAAVDFSLSAWKRRRAIAEAESQRLHRVIRVYGAPEDLDLLEKHGSLHCDDLARCRRKHDEVMDLVHARELEAKSQLKQLYIESGLGANLAPVMFKAFEESLETAESVEARQEMIAKETERYLANLAPILKPLREIETLIESAMAFEANVKDGDRRFSGKGTSLHFLEEERIRRKIVQSYPKLMDSIIEAVGKWEQRENTPFLYCGVEFRNGLLKMKEHDGALVRTGEIGSISSVANFLNVRSLKPGAQCSSTSHPSTESPSRATANIGSQSLAHLHQHSGSGDAETLTHVSATKRSSSHSRSVSPSHRPRRRRDLQEVPVPPPAPLKGVSSPKSPLNLKKIKSGASHR